MTRIAPDEPTPEVVELRAVEDNQSFGITELIAVLWRQMLLIFAVCAAFVAVAGTYVTLEKPRYTATAAIVLDSRKARPNEDIASLSMQGADQTTANSQAEVIRSETILSAVLDQLKLDTDPEFYESKSFLGQTLNSVRNAARTLVGQADENSPTVTPRDLALEALADNLRVERVGATYVISIKYSSPSPVLAAEIANAFVDAYRAHEANAREEQSHRIAGWLRSRLEEIRQLSLKVDGEIQKLRHGSATADPTASNRILVQLRDLERESETYNKLYQTFLTRYQQAIEQESLPIDEARVVTRARAPNDATHPKKVPLLAISIFLGLGVGVGLALFRDLRDRTVRSAADVTRDIGLPYLGLVPVPDDRSSRRGGIRGRYDHVQRNPKSRYAEAMKSLSVQIMHRARDRSPKVIGICSAHPSAGRSAVASNLALRLSMSGASVLLIDADDTRSNSLCRFFGPQDAPAAGPWADTSEIAPRLRFTTIWLGADRPPHPIEEMSRNLSRIVDGTGSWEWVILDLPSLASADASAVAHLVDQFVLVVEWGGASRYAIRSALKLWPEVHQKCLGVLVDSVNLKRLRLYDRDAYF